MAETVGHTRTHKQASPVFDSRRGRQKQTRAERRVCIVCTQEEVAKANLTLICFTLVINLILVMNKDIIDRQTQLYLFT